MSKKIKVSPTSARIYNMKKDVLLQHHALITYKASSLSRQQRDLVQLRVAFGLKEGKFTYEEVNGAISDLGLHVAREITEKFNGELDGNSTKEH